MKIEKQNIPPIVVLLLIVAFVVTIVTKDEVSNEETTTSTQRKRPTSNNLSKGPVNPFSENRFKRPKVSLESSGHQSDENPDFIIKKDSEGKFYFANLDGTPINNDCFDEARGFVNGRGYGRKGDVWFILKPDGTPLTSEGYWYTSDFHPNGYARVWQNGEFFEIDYNGQRVSSIEAGPAGWVRGELEPVRTVRTNEGHLIDHVSVTNKLTSESFSTREFVYSDSRAHVDSEGFRVDDPHEVYLAPQSNHYVFKTSDGYEVFIQDSATGDLVLISGNPWGHVTGLYTANGTFKGLAFRETWESKPDYITEPRVVDHTLPPAWTEDDE